MYRLCVGSAVRKEDFVKDTIKMPPWGPYSKKYFGLSHIVSSLKNEGGRFDFTVHPTLWNSSTPVPNVTVPSAYHLWECSPDYTYYAYRYELLWKDRVYADVSFSKINENAFLARCEIVNNTELAQNCVINYFASLELPFYDRAVPVTPEKRIIKDANDYEEYAYAVPRPWDGENPDGMFKGMFRDSNFLHGCGLGDRCDNAHVHFLSLKPFGCEKGDRVSWALTAPGFENPVLALRYRTVTDGDAVFNMNGEKITLPHSEELTVAYLPFKENPVFVSEGAAGVEFDFIAVIEKGGSVSVKTEKYRYVPEIQKEKNGRGLTVSLDYGYADCKYSVITHSKNTRLRTLDSGCLEDALINRLSNGDPTYDCLRETFSRSFKAKRSDEGFYVNPLIKAIFIEPGERHIEYAVVSNGTFTPLSDGEYENIYTFAKSGAKKISFNSDGKKYEQSINIMKSTLLTNAVYPVYRRGENIVHHTPGKRWDSFYTWDSGFIGLGLLEFSPDLCRYVLDTYLCDEDNKDFTFLLHGSLVPTQFAEYFELLNRSENKHCLDGLYPKMKIYYEFLRGRRAGSTFAKFGNGLLTAYDYWYSCSGMDDYPAQVEMINRKAEGYSCPCLTTSQVIRAGKIMKAVALYLGKEEDAAVYENDIEQSENALNSLTWDEESGYFGYTVYDKGGKPYIMRTAEGENFNKGFDGLYPLVAGAVEGERARRLVSHLKNPREIWSGAGLSAVDMTASYYFDDGYWNGNVWMSHQWFFWKTMLDLGDGDFAFSIADRALEIWRQETDFSYYTYECFGIKTKRGGWFHNFGGLSAPVCVWASAYYKPGSVTTGFDVWTDYRKTDESSAEIKFKYYGKNEKYTVIITLRECESPSVTLDGEPVGFIKRTAGALEITLDGSVKEGVIKAEAR